MKKLIFTAVDEAGTKLGFEFEGKVNIEHYIVAGGQMIEVECKTMRNYKPEENE